VAKDQDQLNFSNMNWAPLELNPKAKQNNSAPKGQGQDQAPDQEPPKKNLKRTSFAEPEIELTVAKLKTSEKNELVAQTPAKEELVVQEAKPKVLSIYELNRWIKNILEGEFPLVWIQGEISNFKAHTSGHFYLSLKDPKAQITAVMFKGFNQHLKFKPEDGMEVLVRGKVTVYEPRGNYQIFIELMEPVGAGALQKAFEQLKNKLSAEGLFAKERKRSLPAFPKHIAIVTSPTGAAIRDMLNVLKRRYRGARITLIAAKVQGDQAPGEVVAGIEAANRMQDVDVMIVGRGGGSIEDLWAFNEEKVARAIAASRIPIISAVGHEIDFTIADFVADLRAPTPSAAAELVVQNADDLQIRVRNNQRNLNLFWSRKLQILRQKLSLMTKALVDPVRMLQDLSQRNDDLMARLELGTRHYLNDQRKQIEVLSLKLGSPETLIDHQRVHIKNLSLRLGSLVQSQMKTRGQEILKYFSLLDSLSPLRVVERGYSIVKSNDQIIKDADALKLGQEVEIRFAAGEARAQITKIISKKT
jgi:exodeoxyribonuclease VII large subunit